jgi:hypothetical protein
MQILHSRQSFQRPLFQSGLSYGIKNYWRRGHLQWYDVLTESHKNLLIASKVDKEDTTHRQEGDLISPIISSV